MKPFADLTTEEVRQWCATKVMGWTGPFLHYGYHVWIRSNSTTGLPVIRTSVYKPDENAKQLRELVVKVCGSDISDEWIPIDNGVKG